MNNKYFFIILVIVTLIVSIIALSLNQTITGYTVKSTGTLDIRITPQNAKVYIDGRFIGTTPLVTKINTGKRTISIEKFGYEPYVMQLSIEENKQIDIKETLNEIKMGSVIIRSIPNRARVYMNGYYYGRTPLELEFEPGIRKLEIKEDGYQTYKTSIIIEKDETNKILAVLSS
ncbi:PEGA domain-containing protein [Candidatus Woesearchaeota archaeon]|nr:PEGA domain-containing protein [Candidatus Woesearchaeota archaeon]